jgi:Domain of unknown function (DUF3846)
MATILYPDGTSREVSPANGTDFQLDELRKVVGGHIEIIPCKKEDLIMVLNEEGKLEGLPRNDQAGALVELATPESLAAMKEEWGDALIIVGDLDEEDYIAGTVLVCRDDEVK